MGPRPEWRALILAGGRGTRFWPLSRKARPKQLLNLQGDRSLLQATLDRLSPLIEADGVWVCTTRSLGTAVRRQLGGVRPERVLEEPVGRNTLPAICWALSTMPEEAVDGIVVVLPSDHWVRDDESFRAALLRAFEAIEEEDRILTLGVRPRWPETGYGYLEVEAANDGGPLRVARFTEKPDAKTASRFVADGRHLWNAGIFVFRPRTLLGLVAKIQPAIAERLEALAGQRGDELRRGYERLPAESIDTGLMQHLDNIYTEPLDCGWNDLGSWDALTETLPCDEAGNHHHGDVVALESRDNLLFASEGTLVVLGVEGLLVVRTEDSVLVLPKHRAQEVRRVVESLESTGRDELL